MTKYVLIPFPESQEIMEKSWFASECFLANPINEGQEWVGNAAYFVPVERWERLNEPTGTCTLYIPKE